MLELAKTDIIKGSQSFSLASFFFEEHARHGSWLLYAWCRHCDDQIDQAADFETALGNLRKIQALTEACYTERKLQSHPWSSFQKLVRKYQIPSQYAFDLLRGMEWDTMGRPIYNQRELIDYCYCVAGTVGLMMCHVMGVNHERALKNAVDLGIALQLTNIARDLKEDWLRDRCYLPREWLDFPATELLEFKHRLDLKIMCNRVLELADDYYESGWQGLQALSWRAAWAVLIASYIYRDIGHQIRSGGLKVFEDRVVVSKPRKFQLVLRATWHLLLLRLRKSPIKREPVKIRKVWSPQW